VKINPAIFRAYDVRGIAETDLSDAFATALGKAYGTVISRAGGSRIAVGRDCRLSSPRLYKAFVAGVLSTGLDIDSVGIVATPLLYFAVFDRDHDGGVQITGSHNPGDYNGFKMMRGKESLHGEAIQHLRRLIETQDYAQGLGTLTEDPIIDRYVDYVVENITLGPRQLNVVVDAGNGAGGPPGERVLRGLGVTLTTLYTDMDGTFPNHHPDPTVEANLADLKAAVAAQKADVGVAYDGDADRIGLVDEQGTVIWGDRLMILLSRDVLEKHPGATIVGEVKCSSTLYEDITKHGGRPIMSRVGHSVIKDRMKREDAMLAGEMSGHIFFRDRWFGFDDAVYVTGRVLEILSRTDKPLSALLADVPSTHVTPEIRLDCPDDEKFGIVERAVAHFKAGHDVIDIDGARVDFGGGWGLIRASNTQPVIVLRAEADTAERLTEIRATLESFVASGGQA
jgi:phosphomannomutase/phosphoglucomutase